MLWNEDGDEADKTPVKQQKKDTRRRVEMKRGWTSRNRGCAQKTGESLMEAEWTREAARRRFWQRRERRRLHTEREMKGDEEELP